eukprot:scaffold1060_cov385-Pavlova_lutheri.AAC.39
MGQAPPSCPSVWVGRSMDVELGTPDSFPPSGRPCLAVTLGRGTRWTTVDRNNPSQCPLVQIAVLSLCAPNLHPTL